MEGFTAITRREMIALAGGTALAGRSAVDSLARQLPGDVPQQDTASATGGQQTEAVRAFVGSYHWGYFVLDESGTELDQLTLSTGDELRLTLFNVEADAAIEALPDPVRRNIPSGGERTQRNEQNIPVPRGTSLEALHDSAEAAYPDHSLAILGDEFVRNRPRGPGQGPGGGGPSSPWGGHHGPHHGPFGSGDGQGPGQGPYDPGMMPGSDSGMMPGSDSGMMPGSEWGSGIGETLAPPVYLWHHSTVPSELGFVVNTTGSFAFVCTVFCGYGHPYMAERSRIVVTEN